MPILNVNSPDLNLFNVKTPNFVNYINGVTDYATGLNAGMDVWDGRSTPKVIIDSSHATFDFGGPARSSHDSAIRQHYIDSVLKDHGWWVPEDH